MVESKDPGGDSGNLETGYNLKASRYPGLKHIALLQAPSAHLLYRKGQQLQEEPIPP